VTVGTGRFLTNQCMPDDIRRLRYSAATETTATSVSYSTSSVPLLAFNPSRLGATVHNDSDRDLFLKLGDDASSSSFTQKMEAGSYYELPYNYVGVITGAWASGGSGAARITEFE